MYCIQCGANLPEEARFCPGCGARQPSDTQAARFEGASGAEFGRGIDANVAELFEDPEESAQGRPNPEKTPSPGAGLFGKVTVSCNKCGAQTPVLTELCLSCGAVLDPNVRFAALVKAGREQHLSNAAIKKAIKDSGVAGKGKGCGCGALSLWVAFWWLMGATAFAAAVPGTLAWTAPVTCPAGYTDVVIPVSVSSFQGKTSMSASMYCIDAEGFAVEVSPWLAFPLVGLVFGAGAGLLVLFLPLWSWMRNRPQRTPSNPRIGGNRPTLPGSSGRRLS